MSTRVSNRLEQGGGVMRSILRALVLALLSLTAGQAVAFDVGDPSFYDPETGNRFRFETMAEWSRRNLWGSMDNPLLGSPSTGPTSYYFAPPRFKAIEQTDQLKLRLTHYPNDWLAWHFNLGIDGETSGGDEAIWLGGAVRARLVGAGPFDLTAQLQADFLPEVTGHRAGVNPTRGPFAERWEYDAYEFGGALLASMRAKYSDELRLLTYAGPRVSAYRGEHSAYADFSGSGERAWISSVGKQASYFGVVVGARLDWGANWSARVEGRFIEEESLSIGLQAAF